jgi:hypothetical protein
VATRIGWLTFVFAVAATGPAFAQTGVADASKLERGKAVYAYWCAKPALPSTGATTVATTARADGQMGRKRRFE